MRADPHLFVIIGATGDLTRRKLLPALLHVVADDDRAPSMHLLGAARSDVTENAFRNWAREALAGEDPGLDAWCDDHVFYQPLAGDSFAPLRRRIEDIEATAGLEGNRVFYLALPPRVFPDIIEGLAAAGLAEGPGWTRLVVEKPFGHDLESARALNRTLHAHFDESQVYRIDHYLGKETVQNLLAFRFANLLFESSWNRDRVEAVEITVAERLGTEGRAGYYDHAGVVRDMVQNHLMQLLSLVAMEAPHRFAADPIRAEKVQLLRSIKTIDRRHVVLGQYTAGTLDGASVPAYREDPAVGDESTTATFAAMRLSIDNWRWAGVPFYLRTGKRLPRKTTHIAVTFRRSPVCIFHGVEDECAAHQNVLLLSLQPDEGFELRFDLKAPGQPLRLQPQPLRFAYHEAYETIPEAYQTLLHDVMTGDQTLFVHADEVEASWELLTPLLDADGLVLPYPAGSWGPEATNEILDKSGPWLDPGR